MRLYCCAVALILCSTAAARVSAYPPILVNQTEVRASGNPRLLLFVPGGKVPPLIGAEDLAFDWEGNLHVTAYFENAVLKYNGTTGVFVAKYGKGVLRGPVGITCGPTDGQMYVASYKDSQVTRAMSGGLGLAQLASRGAIATRSHALHPQPHVGPCGTHVPSSAA